MIIGGLLDAGAPALTTKFRFGADASPGSTFTVPTDDGDGTDFVAGDLAIVCQYVQNTSASVPSSVTPTGWTNITNSQVLSPDGSGNGARMNCWYKILTSGDIGTVYAGMVGLGKNRVCGMALHFSRPLLGITVVDHDASLSAGTPSAILMNTDGLFTGAHLFWGACHGDGSVSDANYEWTVGPFGSDYVTGVAQPDLGSASQTRTWYSFYAQGDAPADTQMLMNSDTGDFNGLAGVLMRIT